MRGLQLVRPGSLAQKSNLVSSVVQNTSCSRGWLRLMVQSIFAALTVASFILILLMALPKWPPLIAIDRESRCSINVCRVICKEVPYFGDYEEDIIHAVTEVEENCQSIFLTLNGAMFHENTMPPQWLSMLRTNIHELTIMNGNLMHVPCDAFMSQYSSSIRVLEFINLELKTWTPNSLIGLSNLRRLYLKNSTIHNVPRNALRSVDDTLRTLTISNSNYWDPTNITGSSTFSHLRTVDFSSNTFKDVLGKNSFTGLKKCRSLYLNSCGITAIGAGAFDNLESIEMIFLHNNHLVTIPAGLFKNIMAITYPKPRINLQDNFWNCNCLEDEIRQLKNKEMLFTDPLCDSPDHFKDKTFSDLEAYCSQKENNNLKYYTQSVTLAVNYTKWEVGYEMNDIFGIVYLSNNCRNGNETSTNATLRMVSPVYGHTCPSDEFYSFKILPNFAKGTTDKPMPKNDWIKLTYFLKTHKYSMVEISAIEPKEYGLLWYETTCPNEVYCVSDIPSVFRIYNRDVSAEYVFCPILLTTGEVDQDNCILYRNTTFDYEEAYNKLYILLFVGVGTVCIVFGALIVYAIIRRNPHLLKGSKRILFVKHRSVDALVLPPKVPLRNDWINPESTPQFSERKIFVVPSNHVPSRFNRALSRRSSKSSSPSYISALQPTEDQLAEWRIRHHFNNDVSFNSGTYSWVSSDEGLYHSIDVDNYKMYESLN